MLLLELNLAAAVYGTLASSSDNLQVLKLSLKSNMLGHGLHGTRHTALHNCNEPRARLKCQIYR